MCVKATRRENSAGKNRERGEQKSTKQWGTPKNVHPGKLLLDNFLGCVTCANFWNEHENQRIFGAFQRESCHFGSMPCLRVNICPVGGSSCPNLRRKDLKMKCSLQKVICILKWDILLIIHEHYLTGARVSVEYKQWLSTPLATQKASAARMSLSLWWSEGLVQFAQRGSLCHFNRMAQ